MAKSAIILNLKNICKKHKKKVYAVSIIGIIFFMFFVFLKISINPIIIDTIEVKSKSIATRAMNSAIADVVMNSIVYDDLINIVTDEIGNISMIQANALEINNLSKDLAQTTEKN